MPLRNGIMAGDFAIVSYAGSSTLIICFEIRLNSLVSDGGNFIGKWECTGTVDGFYFRAIMPIIEPNPLDVYRKMSVGRSFLTENGAYKIIGMNFPIGDAFDLFQNGKFCGFWRIFQHPAGLTMTIDARMYYERQNQLVGNPTIRAVLNTPTRRTAQRREAEEGIISKPDFEPANDDVVVFMKGTQQEPMCGFSRNVKLVLDFHNITFKDYNVLSDQELREGVKVYSDWPTIPQVFVKGEFVGGCDILVSMHKDGEISDFFDEKGIPNKYGSK